jgi:hypothetical protein
MISALNFKIGGGGGACADATVKNSDNTYSTTAASGSTLTLPNITVTDSDGTTSSVPSVQNVTCKLSPVGAKLMKSGQTTSYRTGDDGDIEPGRATSFSVLSSNNPFGNTNRFTSELGTQTYTNNIVIDWSTYNGATVSGYYKVLVFGTWNNAIDTSLALSVGTYTSGWRLSNRNEVLAIYNHELVQGMDYAPFNLLGVIWSSTAWKFITTYAYTLSDTGISSVTDKSGASGNRLSIRTFTVTGTILT